MNPDERKPIFYYRHNIADKAPLIGTQTIGFCELTLVLNGTLFYRINGEALTLRSGDALSLPKGTVRYRDASDVAVDYVSFNYQDHVDCVLPIRMTALINSEIRMLIRALDEIKRHYYEAAHPMILPVMKSIMLILRANLEAKKQSSMVNVIQDHLKNNLSANLRLKDIAGLVSYSPAYCDTLFKKETGCSVTEYLVNLRILEAKTLLFENELTLKQIAESVGYADYNYFARIFKKRTGYTPSAYYKERCTQPGISQGHP